MLFVGGPPLTAAKACSAVRGLTSLAMGIFLGLIGIEVSPWTAAALALTLFTSAFCAEIWRGCVEAVPRGQWGGLLLIASTYIVIVAAAVEFLLRRKTWPKWRRRSGPSYSTRASSPAGSAPATRCVWKPECRSTGRSSTARPRPSKPASAGWSSSTRTVTSLGAVRWRRPARRRGGRPGAR